MPPSCPQSKARRPSISPPGPPGPGPCGNRIDRLLTIDPWRRQGQQALEARIDDNGKRRVLGVSIALFEAEVHWRGFLDSLVARGLRGVRFVTSDDHAGLVAARKAVFPNTIWPGAIWQRCQFHLARNAIHHAPTAAARKAIGRQLRGVWNATDRPNAEAELARIVKAYADGAPKLATWLERAIPEG